MRTRQTKSSSSRPKVSLLALLICVFCVVGVLGLAACNGSSGNGQGNGNDNGNDNGAINSETVSGTIVEINGDELLVDITKSTAPGLSQGLVRVNLEEIDSKIVDSLKVDDKITFEFSGVMGMSEPPFVAATSLQVDK